MPKEPGWGEPVAVDPLPFITAKTSGAISTIPNVPLAEGIITMAVGVSCDGPFSRQGGAISWIVGDESSVTRRLPFARTAIFSVHVPLGNWTTG